MSKFISLVIYCYIHCYATYIVYLIIFNTLPYTRSFCCIIFKRIWTANIPNCAVNLFAELRYVFNNKTHIIRTLCHLLRTKLKARRLWRISIVMWCRRRHHNASQREQRDAYGVLRRRERHARLEPFGD